jgi:YVTN family beta-propeller protein
VPSVPPTPKYIPIGAFPYAVAVSQKSGKVFVTSYRDGVVTEVDPTSGQTLPIKVGAAPDSLAFSPDGVHLWVANGDSDTVSCIDTATGQEISSTLVRPDLSRGLPAGGPEGMAFSKDGLNLYVAMADLNAVALLKVSADGARASITGYAPSGWYPSSVTVSTDGSTLYCLNAKGSSADVPNPDGPNINGKGDNRKYILAAIKGSISAIPTSVFKSRRTGLYPVLVDNRLSKALPPDQASALSVLKSLPIKHVIYVIKENRTYDQVLGDIKSGNGDSDLTLFGAQVTPNEHALSEQFSLLDNFYCCAEVSADGWNWSTSGYASPYVQRTVAEYYREGATRAAHRANPKGVVVTGADYDFEGENRNKEVSIKGDTDVAESPGGYIWDLVAKSKMSYRNFGCFLAFEDMSPTKPALVGHTDPNFAPFDLDFSDSDAWQKLGADPPAKTAYGPGAFPSRYSAWKSDFDQSVSNNNLPAFEIVRLMRDHTSGTAPGTRGGRFTQSILEGHSHFRAGRRRPGRSGSR